ncbi:hypothetical protein [Tenacibaculum singaporense]|uniref:Uncharacterized protein n=1 Tax=Tenacibaculum singaporense TaxID=2358479 RepID=A0A3S8R8U0_9FLAO|nr:hypothetical protein [Tenacibaculum singaporense]AZJ36191.1 hypothetical protein D6T69_11885 [Tenacibaculum singaporense]
MKSNLKSIGAFAQENKTLNNQTMGSVKGGKGGPYEEPLFTFKEYSTSARTEGGDTDCVDYF